MKKPDVPWRCGVVSRNSGPLRVGELRPLLAERLGLEARGVDDGFVLVGVQRADRVDDRAAGARPLGGGAGAARAAARGAASRASAGRGGGRGRRAPSTARRRARGRSPHSSSSRTSALTTRTFVRAEAADVRLELARAAGVQLDRGDLAAQHRRLAAGRGARIEDALAVLRADASAASCEPRLCGQMRPVAAAVELAALDAPGAGHVGRLADGRADRTTSSAGLVLRAHQRERLVLAQVAHPRRRGSSRGRTLGERPRRAATRRGRGSPRRAAARRRS